MEFKAGVEVGHKADLTGGALSLQTVGPIADHNHIARDVPEGGNDAVQGWRLVIPCGVPKVGPQEDPKDWAMGREGEVIGPNEKRQAELLGSPLGVL